MVDFLPNLHYFPHKFKFNWSFRLNVVGLFHILRPRCSFLAVLSLLQFKINIYFHLIFYMSSNRSNKYSKEICHSRIQQRRKIHTTRTWKVQNPRPNIVRLQIPCRSCMKMMKMLAYLSFTSISTFMFKCVSVNKETTSYKVFDFVFVLPNHFWVTDIFFVNFSCINQSIVTSLIQPLDTRDSALTLGLNFQHTDKAYKRSGSSK